MKRIYLLIFLTTFNFFIPGHALKKLIPVDPYTPYHEDSKSVMYEFDIEGHGNRAVKKQIYYALKKVGLFPLKITQKTLRWVKRITKQTIRDIKLFVTAAPGVGGAVNDVKTSVDKWGAFLHEEFLDDTPDGVDDETILSKGGVISFVKGKLHYVIVVLPREGYRTVKLFVFGACGLID